MFFQLRSLFYPESTTALFYFYKKSITQKLLHQLKYNRRDEIGIELGMRLGEIILKSEYKIDAITYVPTHKRKLSKRGYHQALKIAIGVNKVLNLNLLEGVLIRKVYKRSQITYGKENRLKALNGAFVLGKEIPKDCKHILLIDDICTTGATLKKCTEIIKTHNKSIKVSVATLAFVV